MKKILFLITVSFATICVSAQKYESIKNLLLLNQFEKAKTDIDKAFTNEKFASKAEAYILKSAIYSGLSATEANKNTPTGISLLNEAMEAFKKYKEMDPQMELAKDVIYQNAPIRLYSNSYSFGYDDYTNSKWEEGYNKFKNALYISDILVELKLLNTKVDTNTLILAGLTAEKSNHTKDAALFYGRLADNKISGEGYETVYQFLVRHSFSVKDMAAFEKYKQIGAELYPKSDFFTYDKVDFAVGLVEGFTNKSKALQEVLAGDPNNFKANQILGEIIFDTLNSDKEGHVMPANADELEKTMISSFNKAATAKPGFENPYLYLGDHFISKAAKINDERIAHAADTKARTKPGTMASKEDVSKREMLDKDYGNQLEKAREPYEKAVAIFEARAKENNGLDIRDKEQYKKAANFLSEIAQYNRIRSKGNAADLAKYTAEEKKWNDLYDAIKALPTIKN